MVRKIQQIEEQLKPIEAQLKAKVNNAEVAFVLLHNCHHDDHETVKRHPKEPIKPPCSRPHTNFNF